MLSDLELEKAVVSYIVNQFRINNGVDLSLHPGAHNLIREACRYKLEEIRRTGRANIVLPCIIDLGQGYLHLDVLVFLDKITLREAQ